MLAGSSSVQFPDGMPCHSIHTSMVFPRKYVLTIKWPEHDALQSASKGEYFGVLLVIVHPHVL